MHNLDHLLFPDTLRSRLPLGYRIIATSLIPLYATERRYTLYNRKYRHSTLLMARPKKPISKMLSR